MTKKPGRQQTSNISTTKATTRSVEVERENIRTTQKTCSGSITNNAKTKGKAKTKPVKGNLQKHIRGSERGQGSKNRNFASFFSQDKTGLDLTLRTNYGPQGPAPSNAVGSIAAGRGRKRLGGWGQQRQGRPCKFRLPDHKPAKVENGVGHEIVAKLGES